MIIQIKVIPCAKCNKIEKLEDNKLKIHLMAPANKGKANELLAELLADYYSVKTSQIKIIKGHKSRDKVVEIAYL